MGEVADHLLKLAQVQGYTKVVNGKTVYVKGYTTVRTAWRGEVHSGGSNKMFESAIVEQPGNVFKHVTRYGSTKKNAMGQKGKRQSQVLTFDTYGAALTSHSKKVGEKAGKGYVTPGAGVTDIAKTGPKIADIVGDVEPTKVTAVKEKIIEPLNHDKLEDVNDSAQLDAMEAAVDDGLAEDEAYWDGDGLDAPNEEPIATATGDKMAPTDPGDKPGKQMTSAEKALAEWNKLMGLSHNGPAVAKLIALSKKK